MRAQNGEHRQIAEPLVGVTCPAYRTLSDAATLRAVRPGPVPRGTQAQRSSIASRNLRGMTNGEQRRKQFEFPEKGKQTQSLICHSILFVFGVVREDTARFSMTILLSHRVLQRCSSNCTRNNANALWSLLLRTTYRLGHHFPAMMKNCLLSWETGAPQRTPIRTWLVLLAPEVQRSFYCVFQTRGRS